MNGIFDDSQTASGMFVAVPKLCFSDLGHGGRKICLQGLPGSVTETMGGTSWGHIEVLSKWYL